jgi:replicative DNA helicase
VGSNRRPQLSDLRESGSIEQDADMVIFIHRYDYQGLNEDPNDVGKTQIIIAKHRNGAIADVDMMFRSDEVRFVDLSDSLVNQAENMGIESAMNSDSYSYPPASDDFASGGDFSSGGDFASDFA